MSLVRESLPVGIAGLIVIVYLRMDNLMIGWLLGERSVGEYAAAFRITEPFLLLFSSLSFSLYAHFSLSKTVSDAEKTKRTFMAIMIPVVLLSAVLSAFLYVFSGPIIGLLPDKYRTSLSALTILSWSIIFKAVNPQLTAFINAKGQYRLITMAAAFNLAINIALNLFLIPRYGIRGAAGAVVGTEVFNTTFQTLCVLFLMRSQQRSPAQ